MTIALGCGPLSLAPLRRSVSDRERTDEDHRPQNLHHGLARPRLRLRQGRNRRGPLRLGRRHPGDETGNRGRGRPRPRGLPPGRGPHPRRLPLAAPVPPQLLARRRGRPERHQRPRTGPVGHHRQGLRPAGLPSSGRAGPRLHPLLHPHRRPRAGPAAYGRGLAGLQIRPPWRPGRPVHRRRTPDRSRNRPDRRGPAAGGRRRGAFAVRLPRPLLAAGGHPAGPGPRTLRPFLPGRAGPARQPPGPPERRRRAWPWTWRPGSGPSPSGASANSS